MADVTLIPHDRTYAANMSRLSSAWQVKDALGLTDEQTSLEGTIGFIEFILEEEKKQTHYSRMILNEHQELIGVITLKDIDKLNKNCHIGTWIGHPFWGKGYNQAAKNKILHTAFTELELDHVFAGAKATNKRSQKSQGKIPYIRLGVEKEFPEELRKIEEQTGEPCVLNAIYKEDFLNWYKK
ncbi:GNAT family N-acetyltransferase [Virgibacillus kekensis]|uniref:GNAT family N-acetyltransferase n=1 Tax=Virgibacillus kekensis TaxID=202261 RepID=A0ABV9DQE7_9BACI